MVSRFCIRARVMGRPTLKGNTLSVIFVALCLEIDSITLVNNSLLFHRGRHRHAPRVPCSSRMRLNTRSAPSFSSRISVYDVCDIRYRQ
jgi:hypothetical protein